MLHLPCIIIIFIYFMDMHLKSKKGISIPSMLPKEKKVPHFYMKKNNILIILSPRIKLL